MRLRRQPALAIGAGALSLVAATTLVIVAMAPARGNDFETHIARMNGDKEVPGPGDGNATGRARIDTYRPERMVCFRIRHDNMQAPFAGHIHKGDRDEAGPIKVLLFEDTAFPSPIVGCVNDVPNRLIRRIENNPGNFYVNLHNNRFPDGAIRGQLRRPGY